MCVCVQGWSGLEVRGPWWVREGIWIRVECWVKDGHSKAVMIFSRYIIIDPLLPLKRG